jgi:hybrid cluster-associated redox disulfide protein
VQPFVPHMTVSDALESHPAARWVFAAYHLSGCTDCPSKSRETIAEVAEGYRLPLDALLRDLNSLVES